MNVKLVSVTPDAEQTMAYIARVSNPSNQNNEKYKETLSRIYSVDSDVLNREVWYNKANLLYIVIFLFGWQSVQNTFPLSGELTNDIYLDGANLAPYSPGVPK